VATLYIPPFGERPVEDAALLEVMVAGEAEPAVLTDAYGASPA
jgi:hypothetical protein